LPLNGFTGEHVHERVRQAAPAAVRERVEAGERVAGGGHAPRLGHADPRPGTLAEGRFERPMASEREEERA
jgi:hypothetical protein